MVENGSPSTPPAYMLLELADGSTQRVDISGPGGVERVAVGELGRRSSVWRIWANRSSSDLYVAVRNIAGVQKYSFHQSGDWRLQWSTRSAATQWTGLDERRVDQWRRPGEDQKGWTVALTIWVPHGDLGTIGGDDPLSKNVTFVPDPQPGDVAAIRIIVAKPGGGLAELKRTLPIGGFTLANGEIVLILAAMRQMTDEQSIWLEEHRRRGLEVARQKIRPPAFENTRMALFGTAATFDRFVFDLNATYEPKATALEGR